MAAQAFQMMHGLRAPSFVEYLYPKHHIPLYVATSLAANSIPLLNILNNQNQPYKLTPNQKFGLKRFYQDKKHCFEIGNQPLSMWDLMNWFDLFDKLFFGGMLTHYCDLRLVVKKKNWTSYGCTFPYSENPRYLCKIEVYKYPRNVCMMQKNVDYIETLLHEMVHASFQIFACNDDQMLEREIGLGGHGKAWQLAFMHIQHACFHLKLIENTSAFHAYDRECSLYEELHKSCKKSKIQINGNQIRGWNSTVSSLLFVSREELDILEINVGFMALLWEMDVYGQIPQQNPRWIPHPTLQYASTKRLFQEAPHLLRHLPKIDDPTVAARFWRAADQLFSIASKAEEIFSVADVVSRTK